MCDDAQEEHDAATGGFRSPRGVKIVRDTDDTTT
jgi:hypothetical protein